MGAIHGHPEHFHEWLAERGEPVAEEAFLPRGLYATYIRDLLARAEREAAGTRGCAGAGERWRRSPSSTAPASRRWS